MIYLSKMVIFQFATLNNQTEKWWSSSMGLGFSHILIMDNNPFMLQPNHQPVTLW